MIRFVGHFRRHRSGVRWLVIACLIGMGAAVGIPQVAAAGTDVTISDNPTAGGSFVGGVWTPDAAEPASNVNVDDLESALNSGTNATVTTDSGVAGDGSISVLDPLTTTTSAAADSVLTLDAANDVNVNADLVLGGSLVVNADQVSQTDQSGSGVITLQNTSLNDAPGPVVITTGGDQTYNGQVVLGDDSTLTDSSSLSAQAIGLGAYTLTVADGGSSTISGVISGTGGLTMAGAGSLTLSADNTYTGVTAVNSGTLDVSGTVPGDLSVTSGATLAGDGTIGGNVTQEAGGIVAPGTSTGTLSVGGDYTWNGASGATADFQLSNSSSSSDQLAITGALTKGSGSNFEFDFGGTGQAGTTYTLATFASTTFSASDFSYTNIGTGLTGTFSVVNGGTLQFTVESADTVAIGQPTAITTGATGPDGATVTYPVPKATDSAGLVTPSVSCSPAPGTVFPIGTTTVTCTATDPDATNSPASVSFTVTVEGAARQLAALYQAVQPLDGGHVLAPTVAAAQSELAAGHTALASLTLAGFIIEVDLLKLAHVIPAATAQTLTADATQITAVLGVTR